MRFAPLRGRLNLGVRCRKSAFCLAASQPSGSRLSKHFSSAPSARSSVFVGSCFGMVLQRAGIAHGHRLRVGGVT